MGSFNCEFFIFSLSSLKRLYEGVFELVKGANGKVGALGYDYLLSELHV